MSWVVARDLSGTELAAFSNPESTMALQGELINDSKTNYTQRVEVGGKYYYVKRYLIPGKHLRRYLGASRVAREWRNLSWFQRHQVPTPRCIAYGEGNRRSSEYWGVIVSEEAKGTTDLRKIFQNEPQQLQNRHWRWQMLRNLAQVIAKIHEKGFIHNDLQWRNVLVSRSLEAEVYLIDCPAGRSIYLPGNRRGVIRDLAFLDKMAKVALAKTDRLRFYMLYRRIKRLRERDKKEIRQILAFLSR